MLTQADKWSGHTGEMASTIIHLPMTSTEIDPDDLDEVWIGELFEEEETRYRVI